MDLFFLDAIAEILDKLLYQKMFDKKYKRKTRVIYILIFTTMILLLISLVTFLCILFLKKSLLIAILFLILDIILLYWLISTFKNNIV